MTTVNRTQWAVKPRSESVTYSNSQGEVRVSLKQFSDQAIRRLALRGLRISLADRLILKVPSPRQAQQNGIEVTPEFERAVLQRVRNEANLFVEENRVEEDE